MNISLKNKLGMEFPWPEIERTRDSGQLLTLDLELSRRCNFKCIYCYSSASEALDNELSFEEISGIIEQGQSLGVRKVIIIGGGEPLIYPRIKDIIELLRRRGLSVSIFTNGTALDTSLAKYLLSRQVGVVLKLNSMRPEVQNHLCGVPYAYQYITEAINHLTAAGYPGNNQLLGIATIICQQNYTEIPMMWKWAREKNITPYFETVTPQGRGKDTSLPVDATILSQIFNRLAQIDEEEFGLHWDSVHPPLAGMSCNRHLYNCYIRADGMVQSCAGVDIPLGNLKTASLVEILTHSPFISQLRKAEQLVKGKCAQCTIKPACYGCRGAAYQTTGDFLAADPTCWISTDAI